MVTKYIRNLTNDTLCVKLQWHIRSVNKFSENGVCHFTEGTLYLASICAGEGWREGGIVAVRFLQREWVDLA